MCLGFSTYFSKNIVSSPKPFSASFLAESKYESKSLSERRIRIPLPPPPEAAFNMTGYPILFASSLAIFLSTKGVLLKNHLAGGVKKGALTQEQADTKFAAWLSAKSGLVASKVDGLAKADADAKAKALEAEKAVNAARIAANTPAVEDTEEVAADNGADSEE